MPSVPTMHKKRIQFIVANNIFVRLSQSGNFYYAKVISSGSFGAFSLLEVLQRKTLRVKSRLPPRYHIGLTATRSYHILVTNNAPETFERNESQFGKNQVVRLSQSGNFFGLADERHKPASANTFGFIWAVCELASPNYY